MDSAYAWKQYYDAERARLGPLAMLTLVEEADPIEGLTGGAIVIPHTRFEVTGIQIARAVATILHSGVDTVLALGVLHGARRSDRDEVARARNGDTEALANLRGVHDEAGLAAEEFSLDAFTELLTLAARQQRRSIDILRRFPFLVGDDPSSLPGLEELGEIMESGAALVVTADPIHHGHAYGTPDSECRDPDLTVTVDEAKKAIGEQLAALSEQRFGDFTELVKTDLSDFRDTGPVMASLLGPGFGWTMHDIDLVDYAGALGATWPSWVAGALITTT